MEGSWVEFSSKDTSFEPSNGSTYIDGSIRVLVDIPSVNAERVITIEVDASKPGYQPAKGTIVIVVKPGLGEGQPATDIWSLVPLVLLAVIVAVLIIFFSMMRPKKKRRGVRRSRKTSGKASHR